MWQSHIQQLLRIVTIRRHANGPEPHAFIVWFTCMVDVIAMLSNAGTGTFLDGILETRSLPAPHECLPPLVPGHRQIIYPEEEGYFPGLLRLNQEVVFAAVQVGKLASNLRKEDEQRRSNELMPPVSETAYIMDCERRVQDIHSTLSNNFGIWCNRYTDTWTRCGSVLLPPRVQGVCEHVCRTCSSINIKY